jgi:hypothetical protein
MTPLPIALAVTLVAVSTGCSRGQFSAKPLTICQLDRLGHGYEGKKVRVRGTLHVSEHFVALIDAGCPDMLVFSESRSKDIDPLLCNDEKLVEKYGCPAHAEHGDLNATWFGVYRRGNFGAGAIDIERIEDVRIESAQLPRDANGA